MRWLSMKMELAKSRIIKVEGPAFIQVIEGSLSVLGKKMLPKESTVVPKSKVMVFEALEDSIVEVRIGEGGGLEELEDITIPPEWKIAVNKILNMEKPMTIIVLGDVDSGKSTFCTFLANQSYSKGFKTAIIDNDLGQSDIGPPTTIGLGFLEKPVASLSVVPLFNAFFVGSTSPKGLIDRVIVGARKLLDAALKERAEVIVVNTSGWISGRGARTLKLSLALILNPKVIVAIQRSGELEHLLKPLQGLTNLEIVRIPTPRIIRARNKEERRLIRESSYSRYLTGAKTRVFSMDKVGLMFSFVGTGFPIPREELRNYEPLVGTQLLYGEYSSDALSLVTKSDIPSEQKEQAKAFIREETGKDEVIILPQGFERGLLAGFFNSEGRFLGIGVVKEVNFARRTIEIMTPVDEDVGLIILGSVKISESGREIRKLDPWSF
ncbi:MAG: hypothetical protein DRJ20_02435 [Candidatus Methanomethylicota archaeon]|uniref:polynucleotide 5'-hydroxyl-kinase n=1 Tax=Thermoproteota archaeon TaxID=2056631 RepID=A0A497EV05_9CREN|nr:MAG: hypothetical protein DRJ20_02435 [Candidatus Verstraetearchaeota archaeon]